MSGNISNDIFSDIDLKDENIVSSSLIKRGFYSKEHVFPIAALQFELTSRCNMKCKHCYNNSGVVNLPDAMSPEKWCSFSRYIVEHGGIFECMLSGGEPLLIGDSLFDIMDILHDGGTLFYINTNGYLLSDSIVNRLKKYRYHKIQVSIDGISAEYHDSFRQKEGSWEKAIIGAHKIAKAEIPLKVAHCITPENLYDIDAMCNLAYSLGAVDLMIGELSFSGRAAINKSLLLSNEQRVLLRKMVDENSSKFKGKMKVRCSHSVKEGLLKHSRYPNSRAVIRPNGDIRIDGMAPFVIGNILKDDFTDIWTKKLFKAWKDHRVIDYISSFDDEDGNHFLINHLEQDIYLEYS